MLKGILFARRMNKSAKVASQELGLNFRDIMASTNNPYWEPVISSLYRDCHGSDWNSYALALEMLVSGFGLRQIMDASENDFDVIVNKIRGWEKRGLISEDFSERTISAFREAREKH